MTEDQLGQECLGWLADVGWQHRYGPELAPDGSTPERSDYRQVLLMDRLRQAVATLNPMFRRRRARMPSSRWLTWPRRCCWPRTGSSIGFW